MKMTADDPRLTAYALGELSPDEMEQVASALVKQPELRNVVSALGKVDQLLTKTYGGDPSLRLSPEQRLAIHRAGRRPQADKIVSLQQSRWKRPVMVSLAAAAAVTISLMILQNTQVGEREVVNGVYDLSKLSGEELGQPICLNRIEWGEELASMQHDGAAATPSDERGIQQGMKMHAVALREEMNLRAQKEKRFLQRAAVQPDQSQWTDAAQNQTLRVPLIAGNASWQWVKRAVLNEQVLPSPAEVRFEEILNTQSFEIAPDYTVGGIATCVELVQSPTSPETIFALVSIMSDSPEGAMVEAAISVGEEIAAYRMLGYVNASGANGNVAPAAQRFQSGYQHHVMLELRPRKPLAEGATALTLHLHVAGAERNKRDFKIEYSARGWDQASEAAKFALVLNSWVDFLHQPSDQSRRQQCLSLLNRYRGQYEKRAEAVQLIISSLEL